MSRISDIEMPDLRIVPSGALVPHERGDESRTDRLMTRFLDTRVLKNPPLVTPFVGPQGGGPPEHCAECFVVLDGANRVAAAQASKLEHMLVQCVAYEDPPVRLSTWHHALAGIALEELERITSLPGIERRHQDRSHARALLARREAIAYIVYDRDRAVTLHGSGGLTERNDLLNAVVDAYSARVHFYRVIRDSLEDARTRDPDITALVVFPRFQPDEILEIAISGARLPAGITRHVIAGRALRVNVPLDVLSDTKRTLEEKNQWLRDWMSERVQGGHVRRYEESTVLFDE